MIIYKDNPSCFADHMGMYAIEPAFLDNAIASIKGYQFQQLSAEQIAEKQDDYEEYDIDEDGVATIPLVGVVTKRWSKFSGFSSTAARRVIRNAMVNEDVKAISLYIDSPGGAVAGTQELADDIAMAAKIKPVWAFIDDLSASAAYWAASQATKVYANASATIGSIGVYTVIRDSSGKAERDGIKTIVISSGGIKGAGIEGTEITDEYKANLQQLVNDSNERFQGSILRGRTGMTKTILSKYADGGLFSAGTALANGFIDKIASSDDYMTDLYKMLNGSQKRISAALAQQKMKLI